MTFVDGNISVISRKFLTFLGQQNFQKFRFPLFLFFLKNTYIFCYSKMIWKISVKLQKRPIIMEVKCYLTKKKKRNILEILLPEKFLKFTETF